MIEYLAQTGAAGRLREYHARGVITFREHQALEARFVNQLSWTQIELALRVSRTAARSRVRNGLRKIAEHESVAA